MKKWNQVNKRLKTIIAPELKIAFNKSNIFHKTGWSEFNLSHFYVNKVRNKNHYQNHYLRSWKLSKGL